MPDFNVGCKGKAVRYCNHFCTADNDDHLLKYISTELTMSLVKIANVSEGSGELNICVQFSGQFAESFKIFLNASASPGSTSVGENLKSKCRCFVDCNTYFHSPAWC